MNNRKSGGIGLHTVLTLIFIVLKLVGVIDWKWVWVLAPTWIVLALNIIVLLIYIFLVYWHRGLILMEENVKWERHA